jgi:hypothetical protein
MRNIIKKRVQGIKIFKKFFEIIKKHHGKQYNSNMVCTLLDHILRQEHCYFFAQYS